MTNASHAWNLNRRLFLQNCGFGLGRIALASLVAGETTRLAVAAPSEHRAGDRLASRPPHFPVKAKSVIHLFMAGAPSQLDLFDYKPQLARMEGKPIPSSASFGKSIAQLATPHD